MTTVVLIAVIVFAGSLAQRVAGLGLAMVASPFLVLVLDPYEGVFLVNVCSAAAAGLITARLWRLIEWRRLVLLVLPALVGVLPAAWASTVLPAAALQVGVASILLVSLGVSLVVARTSVGVGGRTTAVVSGFVSGFMNSAAGTGGPAMTVYAVLTRWPQAAFAATMQPYVLVISVASIGAKLSLSDSSFPPLGAATWIAVLLALLGGLLIGELVGRRIPQRTARAIVVALAAAGGAVALLHGIVELAA